MTDSRTRPVPAGTETPTVQPGPRPEDRKAEVAEIRSAVMRFLAVGIVTLAVISVPSALLMRHLARAHTLHSLEVATETMALSMVRPLVTAGLREGEPRAYEALDTVVRARMSDGSVLRVTLWDLSRTVLYSDASALVGVAFPEHDWPDALVINGETTSSFEDHGGPTREYEHDGGGFVEVDVLFESTLGEPLVLETYYPAQIVHDQQQDMLLKLLPVGLATLIILQLAQLPSAARLARRVRRLQAGRQRLLSQAAAASDLERRRIARDLHDDVIQGLAGVSYTLESLESAVSRSAQPAFERSREVLRAVIGNLRSMLSEIYPADLEGVGLPAAVGALADRVREQGIEVVVRVDHEPAVDPTSAKLLFRVAREALTNVLKHSQARTVDIELAVHDGREATLTLIDDGQGFDPMAVGVTGHLGLQLIRDTVSEVGGHVELRSAPGEGTVVVASIPLLQLP
ncbi:MAG: histidine kinase [Actinotalea sp.]|nr:histidine kinase [Actinotalea sp.]